MRKARKKTEVDKLVSRLTEEVDLMSRSIVEASVEIAEAVVHADVGVVVGLIQGAGAPPYLAEIICERANYDNPAHRNAIGAALACLQHQAAENGEDTYPIPIYGDHGFEGWSRRKLETVPDPLFIELSVVLQHLVASKLEGWSRRKLEIVQAQPEGSTGK